MLGWFLASIMPFAADWSATASRWALVICASIVVGYATWLIRSVYEFDRLSRDGVRAKGVVIEVKPQHIEFASKTATSATNQPRATRAMAGRQPAPDVTEQSATPRHLARPRR